MVEDSSIETLGLGKGGMTLMDTETQSGVLQHLEGKSLKMASGGSAANTMVGIAQSGGTGAYFGKVAHDTHGEYYKRDMHEAGIDFPVEMAAEQALPTGTCVVLTTPDAERTLCTHLGVSTTLSPDDIDESMLAQSKIAYIEGYLWDAEQPRAACVKTFESCKKYGVKAAFTFSDAFLIDRFADDFKKLVADHCDILFCNADEGRMFFGVDDIESVAENFKSICDLVFLTDGADGCHVIHEGQRTHVAGFGVNAIDTVGAGDAFAGGALYGLTNGMDPVSSAKWGNYLASRVVAQIGPRLEEKSLSDHVGQVVAGVV
ncbi:MAG: adenosine kinase [Planctomycetota bacterium]